MRVLLDECVPRKLGRELVPHEVSTVPRERLGGTKDDPLLHAAEAQFDVFVTVDRNLVFQQNLADLPIAVIVLHSHSNRLKDLLPLVPELRQALNHVQPKRVMHVPHGAGA